MKPSPQADLFGGGRQVPHPQAYAGRPGSGPVGMKCKDCSHSYFHQGASRNYWKCGLVAATGGPGTDIRAGMPACEKFTP